VTDIIVSAAPNQCLVYPALIETHFGKAGRARSGNADRCADNHAPPLARLPTIF
jgi:hypothetical protein